MSKKGITARMQNAVADMLSEEVRLVFLSEGGIRNHVICEIASNFWFDVWYLYKPANFDIVQSSKQLFKTSLNTEI